MRKMFWGIAIVALAVSACATQETPEQRARRMEPMLAAAGFHVHPADTPAKQANLQAMEPLAIRFKPKGNQMY